MTRTKKNPRWYMSPQFLSRKVREKGVIRCLKAGVGIADRQICRLLKLIQSGLVICIQPVRARFWRAFDKSRYVDRTQPEVLYAFYDLAVSPATFDIVVFLVLAELARKEVGCASLHVVIVPGPAEGFRIGDLKSYQRTGAGDHDGDYMQWRLKNILVPCCWLIPSCQQVTVCTSRKEAQAFQVSLVKHLFPKGYTVRFPKAEYILSHIIAAASKGVVIPSIQATPQARRFVSDWIQNKAGGRKVVTITLRECSYEHARNSNLEAFGIFARSLDPAIYFLVGVRDTEAALEPLPSELEGLTLFAEASWNVELRAALYELSYLNMSVNNGPALLFLLNQRAPYLYFKIITPSCGATTEDYYRSIGLEPGSQLEHATPFQRLVWEDDRLEVIQKEFKEMCDRIEKVSAGTIETP